MKYNITYCCMDCGNEICLRNAFYGNGRCYSCSKKGNKAPSFKDGRCLKKYYCIDCNKELSNHIAKRCKSCSNKGKNNPMYGRKRPDTILRNKLNPPMKNKKRPEHSIIMMGINNPNWQNGIQYLPYSKEFNKELKLKIRERDNFICQCCGMTEEEHIKEFNRSLTIHHIDYNKQNCKEENLISLCNICNPKANSNRDYYFAYYTWIIENEIYKGV